MLALTRLFLCAAICGALISPAHACIDPRGIDLNDARFADRILVGRVQNYRIVRDPLERQAIMRLSKDPAWTHLLKRDLERIQRGELMSGDYAKFDVLVHRQLLGKSPRMVAVTLTRPFENSRAVSGQAYVFALRPPPSELARKSYDQYFGEESPEPGSHTVVAGLCNGTFMFEVNSRWSGIDREICRIRRRGKR